MSKEVMAAVPDDYQEICRMKQTLCEVTQLSYFCYRVAHCVTDMLTPHLCDYYRTDSPDEFCGHGKEEPVDHIIVTYPDPSHDIVFAAHVRFSKSEEDFEDSVLLIHIGVAYMHHLRKVCDFWEPSVWHDIYSLKISMEEMLDYIEVETMNSYYYREAFKSGELIIILQNVVRNVVSTKLLYNAELLTNLRSFL